MAECEPEKFSGSHSIDDMKTKIPLGLLAILVFLFAPVFMMPVSAHGDEPRIEISADRLNPGAVLDIRGVDFEMEEEITLVLLGSQVEFPLGTVNADVEGVFVLTITLPVELAEGPYTIRATTDDHVLESPIITVWGTAMLEGGEEGPREEDDGLLAPMPSFAPDAATPLSQAVPVVESAPSRNFSMPVIWIAAGIGVILVLGVLRKMWR